MPRRYDVFSDSHPSNIPIPCNTYFYENKHHVFPGLNLVNSEFNEENVIKYIRNYYENPSLLIRKPLPCSFTDSVDRSSKMKNDKAMALVRNKYRWYRKKSQLLELINRKKQNALPKRNPKGARTKLPYGFVSFTDHLSKNPDKYFKGVYNWYYANVITTFKVDGSLYLLHVGGKNLSDLHISAIKDHEHFNFVPKIVPKLRVSLSEKSPIYEVITSNYEENIGIRQRDVCSYFIRGDTIRNLTNSGISVKRNKYPFLGMDISKNEFCTVDANCVIKFWTTDTCECSGTASVPDKASFSDHFIRVKYVPESNCQNYIIIDRKNIYMFDKRENLEHPCSSWKPENYVEICESLSLLVPSNVENHWYFGLTHSCLLFDIRAGFMQKWSHMLPQTPSIGSVGKISGRRDCVKECLLLSTQSTNDIVAIYNNWSSGRTSQTSFPVSVPNRFDTLHESRMRGVCSHPEIFNMFNCSLIGLCVYSDRDKKGIFSLASSGDVFHQFLEMKNFDKFNEENTNFDRGELMYLELWEKKFLNSYTSSKSHLNVTDVVSMAKITENLDNNFKNTEWNFDEFKYDPLEEMSKKHLEASTDLLSATLLNDFGLNDDEWRNEEENDLFSSRNSVGKVEKWLFESNFLETNPMDASEIPNPLDAIDGETEKNDDGSSIMSFESSTSTSTFVTSIDQDNKSDIV